MCGHDGHTTCLLGFAALFLDNLHLIPSNKVELKYSKGLEESRDEFLAEGIIKKKRFLEVILSEFLIIMM